MCTSFPVLKAAVTLGSPLLERLLFAILLVISCRLVEALVDGGEKIVGR